MQVGEFASGELRKLLYSVQSSHSDSGQCACMVLHVGFASVLHLTLV